jgi:hypothetical protein
VVNSTFAAVGAMNSMAESQRNPAHPTVAP